jgi:ferric-dicitrate binding protein FerR (iron transport regulator)
MDELLVKYLLGEATAAEEQSVRSWINAHKDNRRYFDHFKMIWEQSHSLAAASSVNTDKAWERFKARRDGADTGGGTATAIAFQPARKTRWLKAVAAAAVLAIAGTATYYFTAGNEIVLASADKVLIDTLPDGSVVTLNKNSTLTYAKNFNGKSRYVKLTGEAFFNVTPDKQKPFDIKVDEVKVHVVGTSFNVKNNAEETEVVVETGIVSVGMVGKAVKVLPKQKVVVRKKEHALDVQRNQDDLYNYYRTKRFVCNNTPLYQLAEALGSAYNVKIVIPEERVRNLRWNTTLAEMPLNDILRLITQQFNLSIEQKNGEIILK